MPTALLFLETLGTGELLLIAVAALLLFGPRKLPEISRSLGKSLAEFKRASDDFKRTWEYEVELERRKPALDAAEETRPAEGESPAQPSAAPGASAWGAGASGVTAQELMNRAASAQQESQTVARASSDARPERVVGDGANETAAGGVMSAGEPEQGDIELNAS
jgi:sec-independent protein translocase protein TatA